MIGIRDSNGMVNSKVIENTKQNTLESFIDKRVDKNSIIFTDKFRSYKGLENKGYNHKTVNQAC